MGKVFIVGAGPGDADLLTVRAAKVLRNAEVVLHDALVTSEVLELVSERALLVDVGKRCGQKLLTQDEINGLLVSYSRRFDRVVRLKSGDPAIFGRLGEELEALREAAVEFQIVPGITTVLASAAAAGISLTDRRYASSLVLATAHRGEGKTATEWDRLVTSGSTLAIYMPGNDYRRLSEDLQSAGLASDTPCAVVSNASRSEQRILYSSLKRLAAAKALPAPAHVIVGRCVNCDAAQISELSQTLSERREPSSDRANAKDQ